MSEPPTISACANICQDFVWIGPFTEWLRNVAILLGVGIGVYQLNAWRREHLGKIQAEIALELFTAADETQVFISSVRRGIEYLPPKSRLSDRVQVKLERYDVGRPIVEKLQKMKVKAEAIFGDESVSSAVDQLLSAVGKTQGALVALEGSDGEPTGDPETDKFYGELQLLLTQRKTDEIFLQQTEAMETLKKQLFPKIRLQ